MNIGDTVLYTENGNTFVGTVLEFRFLDGHTGQNDEPLIHVGFFASVLEPGPNGLPRRISIVGTHRQYDLAQFRLDVAHESHVPDKGQPVYPGGRWKECQVVVIPESAPDEPEPVQAFSGSEWYGPSDWTVAGDGLDYPKPTTGITDSGLPVTEAVTKSDVVDHEAVSHSSDEKSDGAADEDNLSKGDTQGTIH